MSEVAGRTEGIYAQLGSPLDFFDRWEAQQWRIADVDLAADRDGWARLGAFTAGELRDGIVNFFLGESAVTETLAPLAHAAPTGEAQIFLATQLADEARHALFFERYLAAVDGAAADGDGSAPGANGAGPAADADGIRAHARAAWPLAPRGLAELLDRELRRVTDAAAATGSVRDWYEGIAMYHLIVEGVLASVGQRTVLETAERLGGLPALTAGMENIERDEHRHIGFGVSILHVGATTGYADAIASRLAACVPATVDAIVNPEHRLPSMLPALALRAWAKRLEEQWGWAIRALSTRVRIAGLGDGVAAELGRVWEHAVEDALDRYESLHGAAHPVRRVRAAAATAPAGA